MIVAITGLNTSIQAQQSVEQRMGNAITVLATEMASVPALVVDDIKAAQALIDVAIELSPEDKEIWRQRLELSLLAEDVKRSQESLAKLHDLEPDNDVLSLMIFDTYMSKLNTATERIEAYQSLLSQPTRGSLSTPIASRLALDLAILHQRVGDHDAYAQWLGESIAADPSYREALVRASTFYQDNTDDPIGEAELLLSMVRADPADLQAQVQVGRLLLEKGAYLGASRIYEIIERNAISLRNQGAIFQDDFFTEFVLATWGGKSPDEVLNWIDRIDQGKKRNALVGQDQEISDLSPALCGIRLAVASQMGSKQSKKDAAIALGYTSKKRIEEVKEAASKDGVGVNENTFIAVVSQLELEWAWLLLLTDSDLSQASALIKRVMDAGQLNAQASDRFAGWLALRSGDQAKARELLSKIAEGDSFATYGIAVIDKEQGNTQKAAQGFLAVARERAGSILGLMAASELWNILGQRTPINETANRLNALAQALPKIIDYATSDPTQLMTFRVRPEKSPIQPFESPVFLVEIINKADFPIAIGDLEPLQPDLLLDMTVRSTYRNFDQLAPLILDVGRRLRLEPQEKLVLKLNLNMTKIGQIINQMMSEGVSISARGFTNFFVSEANTSNGVQLTYWPGVLGSVATSQPLRIDGILPTEAWFDEVIKKLKSSDDSQAPVMLAILSQLLNAESDKADGRLKNIADETLEHATTVVLESFRRQSPVARGWLLSILNEGQISRPLVSESVLSKEPMVQLGILLNVYNNLNSVTTEQNEALIDLVKSDDNTVSIAAKAMRSIINDRKN